MTRRILRATVAHTTGNPVSDVKAFSAFLDGGLLIDDGKVVACGDFAAIAASSPGVAQVDWRGGVILPGLVDAHVHLPQMPVLGLLGWSLLEWLERAALPEEARMADASHATAEAGRFVYALASHGTTTASVFGAHFPAAVAALFEAAHTAGIRISAGLVVSDRRLRPDLHSSPEAAYRDTSNLIQSFHGRGRLIYSVTPRFALSTTDAMLAVCQTLLQEHPTVRVQTHLNEQTPEIEEVARLFPWAVDYFGVYERFGLVGARSIMAHDVHVTPSELERLASSGTSVAHCPASNAALGSGVFPLRRHQDAGVHVALGTDVGGGTGFGMLKEALQAYLFQRIADDPLSLTPGYLLYLCTLAGAKALGLADRIGDFSPGKAADFVYVRPRPRSVLAEVLRRAEDVTHALAAVITLAGQESIHEVRVDDAVVYRAEGHDAG